MKGTLHKTESGWVVKYPKYPTSRKIFDVVSLPLHPYDIKQIEEDAKVFDNIESRINAWPDVEFEIVISALDFVTYAKLKS